MQKIILRKVRFNPRDVRLNKLGKPQETGVLKFDEFFEFSDVQFNQKWKRLF